MNDFSTYNLVLFSINICIISLIIYFNFRKNVELFSPIFFIAIIYLFYTVAGPYVFLTNDLNIFPEKFIRPFYTKSWEGAIVSLFCILIGYSLVRKNYNNFAIIHKPTLNTRPKAFRLGFALCILGFTMYALPSPSRFLAQLNPFSVGAYTAVVQLSGLGNYLDLCINFAISGTCLMLLSIGRISILSWRTWTFLAMVLMTAMIFSSLGFRFRIMLLITSLLVSYYLSRNTKPSFTFLAIIIPSIIAIMGIIGASRSYGFGLDLGKVKNKDNNDLILDGFRDANIFPISGVVLTSVPNRVPYVGFDIIKNAILFPIPKAWYPNKNSDSYIRNPIKIYPQLRSLNAHRWAAMMFYAEWFAAYGWAGLIGISVIIGYIYRRLWEFTKANLGNVYVLTIYATSLSFLYIIISRGYFSFIVMSFFFIIFPSIFIRFLSRIKV